MKYITILFILMGFCLAFMADSCAAGSSDKKEEKKKAVIAAKPQIVFLNYRISKNANGEIRVALINKIVAEGKLKENGASIEKATVGDLKCSELDENSRPIRSFSIENPLFKSVEYVDNSGQFQRKTIELDSAQFSIRASLDPRTKYVLISQITDSKDNVRNLITSQID